MRSYLDRAVAEAERRGERLSAQLRLVVAVGLLVFFVTVPGLPQRGLMLASLGGYGAATLAGVWLAHRGFFRPWLSWVFATIDVGLLLNFIAILVVGAELPLASALATPGAAIIFLFVAHAAMRFRPWLVAYTAGLFVAGIVMLAALGHGALEPGLAGEALRVLMLLLTAIILILTVSRTRRLLRTGILEGRRRANLAHYLPQDLVDRLAGEDPDVVAECRRQRAAVLFVDIRGFTTLSEQLEPEALLTLLREFRRRLGAPVTPLGGTLDKFIGDAMMVVFGAVEPRPDDARHALDCARDMLAALDAWNAERWAVELAPIAVGIGLHYGEVIAGAVGDESRLEYTVIGDSVNIAQRIQELTRIYDTPLLVSGDLLRAAGEAADGRWEALPPEALRGRRQPVPLFRPLPAAHLGGYVRDTSRSTVSRAAS